MENKFFIQSINAIDNLALKGANQVELHFYSRNAENQVVKVIYQKFKPYFFIDTDDRSSTWQNFEKKPVQKLVFGNLLEFKKEILLHDKTYESDIKPVERFLMDQKIFGSFKAKGTYQTVNGQLEFLADEILPCDCNPHFSLLSFDIETSKKNEIISLAYAYQENHLKSEYKTKTLVLRDKTFHQGEYIDLPTDTNFVESEKKLIEIFIQDIKNLDPDFIVGWNVIGFDLKFIDEVAKKNHLKLNLGREGKELQLFEGMRGELRARLNGRVILDGPRILKNNFFSYENFKLNTVAKSVLSETKDIDEDEVDDKWGEIERRYREDPKSLAIYNLKDATLVLDIFLKLNIIELLKSRVRISGLAFEKIGGSTMAFDHHILPLFHEASMVAPNVLDIEGLHGSTGGFVLEPVVGLHTGVAVFDFKSLYPTIISTFKIDPYSRIQAKINPLKNPSGVEFSRTEYFLPKLIDELLEKRNQAKLLNDENLSQSIKILMNSFYGVMGSFGCRFYHEDLPKAITQTGHWILKTVMEWIENKGHQVLYGDTDSIFVHLKIVDIDYARNLVKEINQFLANKIRDEFGTESKLELQFDKIFYRLFLSPVRGGSIGAKKRYAGLISKRSLLPQELGNPNFNEMKLIITGMEFVRQDWSLVARKFQYDFLYKFLTGQDLEKHLKDFVREFLEGKFNEELKITKRLSKKTIEYTKITPMHVIAARKLEAHRKEHVFSVDYVVTKRGPVPVQLPHQDVDYDYYLEKQIRPLADSVLVFQNKSYDGIIKGEQLSLF